MSEQHPPPGWPPAPGSMPPPGWAPPPEASTGAWPPPGTPPWQAPLPPRQLGAAHRPGAVPLRPLGLGDLFDASFRIIRHNAKATVGAAALVGAVAMVIPILVAAIITVTSSADLSINSSDPNADPNLTALLSYAFTLGGGAFLLGIGTIFVTGMVASVTHAAAVGRTVTLGEAWAATRGKRWRLVGLAALLFVGAAAVVAVFVGVVVVTALAAGALPAVLVGLLGGLLLLLPALLLGLVRWGILATPALMLEPIGVFAACGRAWALSQRQFWRLLGIWLLMSLVAGLAGGLLSLPFNLVGQVGALVSAHYGLLILVAAQSLGTVARTAFTAPFSAAVNTLLYLDQRMRKEAYDVELMSQAGLLGR